MHNKVVYHTMKAFSSFGLPVLRFNFRSVGLSEGSHDEGYGEQEDVRAALNWMEQNFALFRALRLEKLVTAIFIGLITFVAGLNILVVLSMMVTDKARDIAVLMSMGTRREQIRKIFLWQGIAIGFTGTLIGLCVGYAFALIAGTYHLIPLDPQIYAVSYVPFHPSALDGVWITLAAMGISIGATILPARAAARLLPVEILRYE